MWGTEQEGEMMMRVMRVGLRLVCVVFLGVMAESVGLGADSLASADVEQNLTDETVGSLTELLALYDKQANAMLPILVPDETGTTKQVVDSGQVVFDDLSSAFPADFLSKLSTKGIVDEHYQVACYPLLILLDEKTHDYLLIAFDGEELLRVLRPKDYDPFWYAKEHFLRLGVKPSRKEFLAFHTMFNPARIAGWMTLINPEAAAVIAEVDEYELQALQAMPLSMPLLMMGMGGSFSNDLHFAAIVNGVPGSNDVQLTIGYPSSLYGVPLDIVSCDDLIDWNWSVAASTNLPSGTNFFDYAISPASTNREFFACYRTDIPAGDTDGDGVPDGEERFLDGTDPANPHDPPNISGTVSYTDWEKMYPGAEIIIRAFGSLSPYPYHEITLTTPGAYWFPKLTPNDYYILAVIDQDGNGGQGGYEPYADITNYVTVTGQVVNVDFAITDVDGDSDGLPDWWEYRFFYNTNSAVWTDDGDFDALNNRAEFHNLTDPTDSDTDGDNIGDGAEVARGFNPVLPPLGYSQYMGIPFTETFESPGVVTGDLDGENRWTASPAGQALVQTGTAHGGSQAVALTSGSAAPRIEHIIGTVGASVVWIDYYARIDLATITIHRDHPDIAEVPTNTVSVFAMNADGDIYAYNGTTNAWVLATQSGGITGNAYHRYTVKQNYGNKTWDLYIDGVLRKLGLGFRGASVVEFTQFSMMGTKGGGSYCDNISISTTKPAGIP